MSSFPYFCPVRPRFETTSTPFPEVKEGKIKFSGEIGSSGTFLGGDSLVWD